MIPIVEGEGDKKGPEDPNGNLRRSCEAAAYSRDQLALPGTVRLVEEPDEGIAMIRFCHDVILVTGAGGDHYKP